VHYLEQKKFPLAQLFVQQARDIPRPEDAIFVETAVYDYLIAFGHAICCYWSGQHAEAIRVNNQVLATPGIAPEIFDRALKNRRCSLDAVYPKTAVPPRRTNRFKVLVPFRNPGAAFDNCIASLLEQDHADFDLIFFDNASTDESVRRVPTDDPRARLIRSQHELPRTQVIHDMITQCCRHDDIIVTIDGADWLAHREVLSKVNDLYNMYDCWVLYGQYGEANGRYGTAQPYSDEMALRQLDRCRFPHLLQTFRASLYFDVHAQDPGTVSIEDRSAILAPNAAQEPPQEIPGSAAGRTLLPATSPLQGAGSREDPGRHRKDLLQLDDDVLMVPLLRRAGFDKVRFNDEVMYILNTDGAPAKRCSE
jgi:hypothetical protein